MQKGSRIQIHAHNQKFTTMRLVHCSYPVAYRGFAPLAARFNRSPWSGLETEIDRLFTAAQGEAGGGAPSGRFPVDVYEDKANTYVRADLPGVDRKAINVEVVEGTLILSAERKMPAAEGRAETSISFRRSLQLGEKVQADRITAAYENGVLTVTLPKPEEVQPKKITVTVS